MLTAAVPAKLPDLLRALVAPGCAPSPISGHPRRYFETIHWKRNRPMKVKNPLVCILAVLITLPLVGTVAPAATITVLQTFDYPDLPSEIAATLPQKISDQGDLVGTVIDISGIGQGFIYRYRGGKFSAAFHDPNDTGHLTQGRGINNLRHVVGEYLKRVHAPAPLP